MHPLFYPGGRGSSVNMKSTKSVIAAHLEEVLANFSVGGGTGKALVRSLDKNPTAQHLGSLYLKVTEDHPDCLILDGDETATLHHILEEMMRSFALYGHPGYHGTGRALVGAVRQYMKEYNDSPVRGGRKRRSGSVSRNDPALQQASRVTTERRIRSAPGWP